MNKEQMVCQNCIFLFQDQFANTCRVNSQAKTDDTPNDSHYVDFPSVLHPNRYWCGQGEWFGESRTYPGAKMLFHWGEWSEV